MIIQALAIVGATAILIGIAIFIASLHELFERVEQIEITDNIRRDDIIGIKGKIRQLESKQTAIKGEENTNENYQTTSVPY